MNPSPHYYGGGNNSGFNCVGLASPGAVQQCEMDKRQKWLADDLAFLAGRVIHPLPSCPGPVLSKRGPSGPYADVFSITSYRASYSCGFWCAGVCIGPSVQDFYIVAKPACPAHSTATPAINPTSCACHDTFVPDAAGKDCIPEPLTVALSGLGVTVMPKDTLTTAYAQVTRSDGSAKSGAQVTLILTVVPENNAPIRAEHVGSISPNGGSTDSNGRLNFTFTAPSAGGVHTVHAACADCTNVAEGTIKVPGCDVHDLPPITDPEVQLFEDNPDRSDTDRLASRMGMASGPPQGALLCLRNAIRDAGGTSTVGSAFRPPAYNQHMIDVWDKWMDELRHETNPACQPLRSRIEAHFNRHGMVHRPVPNSRHTQGEAFDLTSSLPYATLDTLADGCQVYRNIPVDDRVHFIHR